ncbi:MAG: WD40/YVTN/BNR-like repeat-containing protein [Acidimicrobiales bacterium]
MKGLFFVSDGKVDGPFFKGEQVTSFLQLSDRYLAGTVSPFFGPNIRTSTDGGGSWDEPTGQKVAFPQSSDSSVVQIWQLQKDNRVQHETVLAGVEPAAMFWSQNGAESFELVDTLWDHPHRPEWQPGGGGLGLHTILTHVERPDRVVVGISTGGVYRSDDRGRTWAPRNKGISARYLPEDDPEFGQCVHKIVIDAEGPDVFWLQNHWGIYRSTDAGDNWEDVGRPGETGGVTSDFGFPIVAHPSHPGTAFVFPVESDEFRCSPSGRCLVYRTTDGGNSWEGFGMGLPQSEAYMTVLRDAFTVGTSPPYPFVFGTRTGQVYASADCGEHWRVFAEHLPPVLCVRVIT